MKRTTTDVNKIMLFIIGGFAVLSVGTIGILSRSGSTRSIAPNPVSYQVTDSERPKATIVTAFADMGTLSVKAEKTEEFIIKNTGNAPLVLSNISSSCGCTVGRITIESTVSPEFSMHAKGTWQGTVQPGKSAVLAVVYRPYIMPVKGPVTRDVYIQTNDPDHAKLTFSIKAIVQ